MRSPPSLLAKLALLAVLASHATPASSAQPTPAGPDTPARDRETRVSAGRFVLRGTARVDVTNLPARHYPVDVLALVAPGPNAGAVVLHLRARGYACELRARLDPRQMLAFHPGQVCAIEQPGEQPARLRAELRSGKGRLRIEELSLELTWEVSGTVRSAAGAGVTLPGTSTTLELPPLPVSGTVAAEAQGRRDVDAGAPRRR